MTIISLLIHCVCVSHTHTHARARAHTHTHTHTHTPHVVYRCKTSARVTMATNNITEAIKFGNV